MIDFTEQANAVVGLADDLAAKGWLPATSGNLSVKVSDTPLQMAITRSGADKQQLAREDVLLVDANQRVVEDSPFRPSAETVVHIKLYEKLHCGAILHVHTMYNNLISDIHFEQGFVPVYGHELLKALNHWEEHAAIDIPIVENFHDLDQLGEAVEQAAIAGVPGVLVRNHGIYAWGQNADEAKRFLEAFEFLFEYSLKRRLYPSWHDVEHPARVSTFTK